MRESHFLTEPDEEFGGEMPRVTDEKVIVRKVKQYLPANKEEKRPKALVQFWVVAGGLRTVCARDIVHWSGKKKTRVEQDDDE